MDNVIAYTRAYDSALLRGIDDPNTPRPWDIASEIKMHACKQKTLLDIGCGSSFKTIKIARYFKQVVGVDISQSMIDASVNNITINHSKNMPLVYGDGYHLPFKDLSFDIVTCILSRWDIREIYRVLKQKGLAIIEHIGCDDKRDFKLLFGKDAYGYRGQLIENTNKHTYIKSYYEFFIKHFQAVSVHNGFWNTYYTEEGLNHLLKNTPTIRHYDEQKDREYFLTSIQKYSTNLGIKLTQNRILIYAKKHT